MGDMETPTEIVAQGGALQKSQTEFTQAIAIQKPRQRMDIIKACEEEAAIAGEDFYYSWSVKSKGGRSSLVEGLSVGGALAAARNWGNCALPCTVEEKSDHYVFTASFVDFETGFNMQRIFKQRKEQNIGMKDTARADDITFQIGQSKAIRNVCLNALPNWLTGKMLAKAKEEVIDQITKMGIPVAQKKALEFFEQRDIPVERVEKKIGKNHSHWNAEDLAMIKGAMSSLVNGQESVDSLFPAVGEEAAVQTNKKTDSLKEKIAAKKAAKPTTTQTRTPGETSKRGEDKEPAPHPIAEDSTQNTETETGPPLVDPDTGEMVMTFTERIQEFARSVQLSDKGLKAELESLGFDTLDDIKKPEDQETVEGYLRELFKLD